MPKALDPDHFKLGVLFNLVMLYADSRAVLDYGDDVQLTPDQAHELAGEAWGNVTRNFLVFDDDKGTLAKEYAQHRERIIEGVFQALLVG